MDRTAAATSIIGSLLAAGVLTYIRDAIRAFRARKTASLPEVRDTLHVESADKSLLVVVKARDELEEDNSRLRVQIVEERARHAEDRARWTTEKTDLRAEIDALEAKLRAVLVEVEALRDRTG